MSPSAREGRLDIRDVAFRYAARRFAMQGVSLDVAPGELVALLGPNGSGKSTLVRLVMRLLTPHAGSIRLDGDDLATLPAGELARRVAYVPQETQVAFGFTALETVLTGRSPHTGAMGFEREADLAVARAALERVEATDLADAPLDELSGGERQRVILARALAQEAPLLVLDEPGSHLDIRHQYGLFRLLRDLSREAGRACLCVSHDLNVAAGHCDRVVVLSEGRVAAAGTPGDVLSAELVGRVYGIEADVLTTSDGRPAILPRAG